MHIIISGGRWFNDADVIADYLAYLRDRYGDELVIITGGAPGADTIAEQICALAGITCEVFTAHWGECGPECPPVHMKVNSRGELYCPTAGHRRNQRMLDRLPRAARNASQPVGGVAAFIDRPLEKSRGTQNMVELARKADVPVRVAKAKQLPEAPASRERSDQEVDA